MDVAAGRPGFFNALAADQNRFVRCIPKGERLSARRAQVGERGIWQRRFWEHSIRDEGDFARHMDYIHYNPVKHGHARCVADWPHSTFHHYVRQGVYPLDWAADEGTRLMVGE